MKPRVLIVEDEPAIVDTIQYALETEGFETARLSSGRPVIDYLERNSVDLIVLDIGLPDMNGLDLCREIRKNLTTPIIFLTARIDEVDRVVGLEIGGDDYVTKPFSPRELSARVRAVLRRTLVDENSCRGSKVFEINESKRLVFYHGKTMDLSRYEYEILKIFVRRPGHVYSREMLMDLVWEQPEASLDRTVDAHIKNIRAKLKAIVPDCDPIVTHRGTGYSLREGL